MYVELKTRFHLITCIERYEKDQLGLVYQQKNLMRNPKKKKRNRTVKISKEHLTWYVVFCLSLSPNLTVFEQYII